jgi:hypothetical protein
MRKVGAMLRKALSGGILSVNNFSRVRKCRERFEERIGSECERSEHEQRF